jgi:hypothetical protein
MAQYGYNQNPGYGGGAQNLQFYSSSFSNQPVSGHSTPFQANYGAPQTQAYPAQYGAGFSSPGVSGQMGVGASGLRTGWLAAFGTEGYVILLLNCGLWLTLPVMRANLRYVSCKNQRLNYAVLTSNSGRVGSKFSTHQVEGWYKIH